MKKYVPTIGSCSGQRPDYAVFAALTAAPTHPPRRRTAVCRSVDDQLGDLT